MKPAAKIFTALFLLLCLIPGAGLLIFGPSEARANEAAPRRPELIDVNGALNAGVLDDTEDYVNEAFSLRQELITLWAHVEALFGESAEDEALETLRRAKLDTLSPIEAMNLLYELQRKLEP